MALIDRRPKSISPENVETALLTKAKEICLLDCVYRVANYTELFLQEHIDGILKCVTLLGYLYSLGAQHFDIEKVITAAPTNRRNLVHPLDFQNYTRTLGITDDCHIVLYDHGEDAKSLLAATYAWWLFQVIVLFIVFLLHSIHW